MGWWYKGAAKEKERLGGERSHNLCVGLLYRRKVRARTHKCCKPKFSWRFLQRESRKTTNRGVSVWSFKNTNFLLSNFQRLGTGGDAHQENS